jgi:alkylhydroperoxidase family enzyme
MSDDPESHAKARESLILGHPPRIAPLTEVSAEMREWVVPAPGYGANAGPVPPLYGMLLHNPELLKRFKPMSSHFLIAGALAPQDREIAILRVAWLCQTPYVWGEHCNIAHRIGLSSDDVERVIAGPEAGGWSEHQRAILRAVDELRADTMISDATWATLAKTLDAGRLIELPILIGQYRTLCGLMNSVRLPLLPGNGGLAAR